MGAVDDNLGRVTARIGACIIQWYALRIASNQLEFHAEDMRAHVTRIVGEVAPGSPDRVMRALRKAGAIGYKVLDRAQSLYLIQLPEPPQEEDWDDGVRVQLDLF